MTANMHSAGYGLVSEYLTHLAMSDIPVRIHSLERIVGGIGIRTNDVLAHLLKAGVSHADVAEIHTQLIGVQTSLAREIAGK